MRIVSSSHRDASSEGLRQGQLGFTLVELMITLAVVVVLVSIAIPSFRSITLSNRLSAAASDVVIAINAARMEAVKRNGSVQVCSDSASSNTSDTLGTQCSSLSAGAVVGLSALPDGTRGAATLREGVVGITASVQFKGSMTALRFSGQGLASAAGSVALYDGQVVDICTDALSADNHRVVSMKSGSVLQTDMKTGACSS